MMTLQQVEGANDRALVDAETFDVRPIEVAASYGQSILDCDRRIEPPSVRYDVNEFVENAGRDDESYVFLSELVDEEAAHGRMLRHLGHVGVDQDIGIDPSSHGCPLEDSAGKISS
jgi:hypothetical protein